MNSPIHHAPELARLSVDTLHLARRRAHDLWHHLPDDVRAHGPPTAEAITHAELRQELALVRARVQHGQIRSYRVHLELDRDHYSARCDCSPDPCPHIAAVAWALTDAIDAHSPPPADHAWRDDLAHLDRFLHSRRAAPDPQPDTDADTRIAWRVHLTGGGRLEVHPYEQKRRANGDFTRGRKVSIQRLRDSPQLWTRPDIRQVVACIDDDDDLYGDTISRLDHARAALALVGCPHVSWLDDPDTPVEVLDASLTLRIDPTPDGGLHLLPHLGGRPVTVPAPDLPVLALAHGARLLVAPLDPDLARLAHDLGPEGRVFPPQARADLLPRLQRLETTLPLDAHPDLDTDPVDADPRLRLRLFPRPHGLRVEARIQPLPHAPSLLPGAHDPADHTWTAHGRAPLRRDLTAERDLALETLSRVGLPAPERPPTDPSAWTWNLDTEPGLTLTSALQHLDDPRVLVEWPDGEPLSVTRTLCLEDLRVRVSRHRDWFRLSGDLDLGDRTLDLAQLLDLLQGDARFLPLGDRDFVKITRALRHQLRTIHALAQPHHNHLQVDPTAAPNLALVLDTLPHTETDEDWDALRDRLDALPQLDVTPPDALQATLRPYQRDGYAWLKRLAHWGVGACLADDMGLGKTLQAIAVLLDRAPLGPTLVVAPTSVGTNWLRELRRFAPSLEAHAYRDTNRAAPLDPPPHTVLVISYDLARIDRERLASVRWSTLVVDEAQHVKNSLTQTAQALRDFDADWRLALTGTPVENHLGELWSLFRLIAPGVLGGWTQFKRRFAEPIERGGSQDARDDLALRIRPFLLRRTKAEVLDDLPDRTEIRLDVELSDPERRAYEDARIRAALHVASPPDDRDPRFQVLAELTRLRQLACHPLLLDPHWPHSSAKLDALIALVDDLRDAGHRALIFSQFTRWLTIAHHALRDRGVRTHYLDGRTPTRHRQAAIDAFQAGDGDVFLISLKAGGTGLNLTAANYVIHLDPWWNPAVEDQATDRAHRLGQTRPVTVYRLVARDTVEDHILDLHHTKRDLVDDLLSGADQASSLSTDDLVRLIQHPPA